METVKARKGLSFNLIRGNKKYPVDENKTARLELKHAERKMILRGDLIIVEANNDNT